MLKSPDLLGIGSRNALALDPSRALLSFKTPQRMEAIAEKLRATDWAPLPPRLPGGRTGAMDYVNHTPTRIWIALRDGNAGARDVESLRQLLPELDWIGPVYRDPAVSGPRGEGCPLPDVLLIKSRPAAGRDLTAAEEAIFGLSLEEDKTRSAYLLPYRCFRLRPGSSRVVYDARESLLSKLPQLMADVTYEYMPLVAGLSMEPNDTLYGRQWNLQRIGAAGPGRTGWDITAGDPGVVIAILDWGCDLAHPDLVFAGPGVDLGSMSGDGSGRSGDFRFHGTCCAGIAAARLNNRLGVAGVAGACRILPLAFHTFSNAEVAAGINYAAMHGARVISMSFGLYAPAPETFGMIVDAIENAVRLHDCVLVASTGNEDFARTYYPAASGNVISVGASDEADNRKTPRSPDGQCWGSNYGPGRVSVMAPGVLIATTDRRGADGMSSDGGPLEWYCVDYPQRGDPSGDYFYLFGGTSSAAPQVAGLAALLCSRYPGLSSRQVRSIIERTADRVGVLPYIDSPSDPNGPVNDEMGHGRINVLRALDLGDVYIRDWPRDSGAEPSTPPGGNFWDTSDIVVRPADDDWFDPTDIVGSSRVERGRDHYLYVRLTNAGPEEARNVSVTVRIAAYVGVEFVYPGDWTAEDAEHIAPLSVSGPSVLLAPGGSAIAKFRITAAQADALWGWTVGRRWHPCVLAMVNADNDHAFSVSRAVTGSVVTRRNNLAQKNLSVVGLTGLEGPAGEAVWPLIVGSRYSEATFVELVIDAREMPPSAGLILGLDEDFRDFPVLERMGPRGAAALTGNASVLTCQRVKLELSPERCSGLLTLEKDAQVQVRSCSLDIIGLSGADLLTRYGRRYVKVAASTAVIQLQKEPHVLYPVALHATLPTKRACITRVHLRGAQGEVLGGASVHFAI